MELTEESKKSLLIILKEYYDYDFTGYAEASLNRRIIRFAELNSFNSFFELRHELINNKSSFERFVEEITVNVTEMFRDPDFYMALKNIVFPAISSYPFRRIWHAGCSTGEEVYSLAILLNEHDLYKNTRTFATDINQQVLNTAKEGVYKPYPFHDYQQQYKQAGGKFDLDHYYDATHDGRIKMHEYLRKNVLFTAHNLVSDGSFNEFNLIVCRNVLIYFDKDLQERVFGLFAESLCIFGYLALGPKETIQFSKWRDKFEVVDKKEKIYRKIG